MADAFGSLPRTSQSALTEYSDAFKAALVLADVEDWATVLGFASTSNAIKSVYPLPIYAAGYQEFEGEVKYRSLYGRMLTMRGKQWQDGVTEKKAVIEADDFMGWGEQPAAMALEAKRLPNQIVADMLALNTFAGPALDLYRDLDNSAADVVKNLFATDHLNNVLDSNYGTFNNIKTASALDDAMLVAAKAHFRSIKGPNGKPLGLRMTHLLVPAALEQQARDLLESDILVQAVMNVAGDQNVGGVGVPNRHKGTVTLIVSDELTSDTRVYPLALNKPGLKPWIVQTSGAPLELVKDESSDYYKDTLKVSFAHVIDANAGAAFPQPILRVTITG